MVDPAMRTLAEQLAAFARRTAADGAPEPVRTSVRQRILDVAGLQAAALALPTSQAALSFVVDQGGAEQANVVGIDRKVPAAWAAFANGVLAHSLDFDDTHLPSILHPSASVVPAAIAAGELVAADGARVMDAAAVGIETVVRLGMVGFDRASNNSIFFEHGQHATSICGAVGSAVAAAMLLADDEVSVVNSIGVAASMASGILEGNRTGGTVKRLHCGWAAHAGTTAALLVSRGFTGPSTALEGRFGFFEAFLRGDGSLHEVTTRLGEHWEVPAIFFKPYPANHFTHAGLDAAARLRARGLKASDVEEAVLGVATPAVRTIGEPIAVKQHPETGYQAQFSGPYMVALGLLGGSGLGAGLDDFTDDLARDTTRRELMSRIRVEADETCDRIFPHQFPAVLRVRTRNGRYLEERVLANRGGPENPLSDEEIAAKYVANALRSYSPDRVSAVADFCSDLEKRTEVGGLLSPLGRPLSPLAKQRLR